MPSNVIDVHAHIGRTVAMDVTQTFQTYMRTMDSSRISQAILSPMAGGRQADGIRDTMAENDAIAQALRTEPDRFPIGLASVEIRHEEKALEELRRCFDTLGLHGVSFHAMFSGFSLSDDAVLDPLLALVDRHTAICLMHAMPEAGAFSMESPRAIGELAVRYPNISFIMGHPAITEDARAVAIEAALGRQNVYVDLAYQSSPRTVETLVRALGSERILFGSDSPFRDPAETMRSVTSAGISQHDKDRILFLNAAALIARHV